MADIHDEVAKLQARRLVESAKRLDIPVEEVFVDDFVKRYARERRKACSRRVKRGKARDERDNRRPLIK